MNNNYIVCSFNLVSIIIIMIIYFIVIKKYVNSQKTIETFNMNESSIRYNNIFKYKPSNARIMYNNTGELPWNRHIINSSIPYDIDIKQEAKTVVDPLAPLGGATDMSKQNIKMPTATKAIKLAKKNFNSKIFIFLD